MRKEGLPRQGKDKRVSQLEDRVLKTAAQFFGEDLLSYMDVKGMIDRMVPIEHIHLEMCRLEEDPNFIVKDGSWRHLEFESDSITQRDSRRFREYGTFIGMVHNVPMVTIVLCTSNVKILKGGLVDGNSIYRTELARLKDRNAENVFEKLERRMKEGEQLERYDVSPVLLSPLMSGEMAVSEHICQGTDILQRGELGIRKGETKRIQSVLYALMVRFLKGEELRKVKERIGMTTLGQILWGEGIETGLEEGAIRGMAKGIQVLILDNMEEGIPRGRIIEKLCRRSSLSGNVAVVYYEKYAVHDDRQSNMMRREYGTRKTLYK